MSNETAVSVNWQTQTYDNDICNMYKDIMDDILCLKVSSEIGYTEINDLFEGKQERKIMFNNSVIKTRLGENSTFSPSATIAALANTGIRGYFIIPPDLIDYINNEINSESILNQYLKSFPNSTSIYEDGKALYESFIKSGYPPQAAYSLCGAAYVECAWNPNVYNKAEKSKGSGTVGIAGGWSGCGEGLFGLTGWNQKKRIIESLGYNKMPVSCYSFSNGKINKSYIIQRTITNDKSKYNDDKNHNITRLFQCTEDIWVKIMKEYLRTFGKRGSDSKSTYDYLMYDDKPKESRDNNDDDHRLLYASYLFKAGYFGNNKGNNFQTILKTVTAYKNTHKKIYGSKNPNYIPVNGFIKQLLIAYLLAEYVNGTAVNKLNLNNIVNISKNYVKGKMSNNKSQEDAQYILFKDKDENKYNELLSKFKRNPKGWNIKKACEWIRHNSSSVSQHVCAKHVRQAIEAGGISTNNRPNWAYKYIDYLPTIGFKFLQIVKRGDTSYKPEPGDIAVYKQNGRTDAPGHICMWDGYEWCSDFRQKNMLVYSKTNEAHIFRFEG